VLIAPGEYNNLGIGYISSMLKKSGFCSRILDFNNGRKRILKYIRDHDPVVIGFSITAYGYIEKHALLLDFLRKNGVCCHFTAGGHYPSLRTADLFERLPQLDSIVRFEGEYTIVELVQCITGSLDWKNIEGLAYRISGSVICNSVRQLEKNIDHFPFPKRNRLEKFAFELPLATIISGRGCLNNCTFCNTKSFYKGAGGPLKRVRKPEMVVSEMISLKKKRKCSVFLFMDDDFPVNDKWVLQFCRELQTRGLSDIFWKICCRPDEVEEGRFAMMKKNGMTLVFIGIEDGTNSGLERMNKRVKPEQIRNCIGILKKLGIGIDFGFLLFQPWTTFSSLYLNLDFLREICSDGYMPVTFQKMMPLYETRIAGELARQGRLRSSDIVNDYDLIPETLELFYKRSLDIFSAWLTHPYGLANLTRWVRNHFLVYRRYYGSDQEYRKLNRKFRKIVSDGNNFLIRNMKELALLFESGPLPDEAQNERKTGEVAFKHQKLVAQTYEVFDRLYSQVLKKSVENLRN
jgi:anaerobic magnesium-protoporphyrin IX monomethyl ester cyclase